MALDLRFATGEQPFGDSPVKINCINPDHDDGTASLAVYPTHAHCFGCGLHLDEREFLARTGIDPEKLPTVREGYEVGGAVIDPKLDIKIKMWALTLRDSKSPRYKRNRFLWEKYGLWPETIDKYQIGHTGTRFSIPIWDGPKLCGVRFRLDPDYNSPEFLARSKYIQPRGQSVSVYRPNPTGSIAIICEGEMDALALVQLGYDGITTTGGSGSLAKLLTPNRLKLRGKPLYIATDRDAPGDEAYYKLCTVWRQDLPRLRWETGKDVTEALGAREPFRRGYLVDAWVREAQPECG